MRAARRHAASVLALALLACDPGADASSWREGLGSATERTPEDEAALHAVRIHEPPELTTIATSADGPAVACVTCHSLEGLVPQMPASADEVGGPHAGLAFEHGSNACTSCHAENDVTSLRLADGTIVEMRDAMRLCAQCHGPQYRDYRHGSHGGMRGYWDRTRGPRDRNHCIDCHDPHAPRYPTVLPMPPPRDRVRPASGDHHTDDGGGARHE